MTALGDMPPITDDGPVFEPVATFSNGSTPGLNGIVCSDCAKTFEHNKPGRRPKKCPDCRSVRSPATTRATGTRIANLEQALTDTLVGIGTVVCLADTFDGQVVMAGSPNLAHALTNVASRDPKVRKALERLLSSMGWGEVLVAVMGIAAPIMAHHGMLPSSIVENMRMVMSPPVSPNGQTDHVPTG